MTDKSDRQDGDGLLPCPFCGSPARYDRIKSVVRCTNDMRCSITGPITYDRTQVIARWNTRPTRDGAEGAGEVRADAMRSLADHLDRIVTNSLYINNDTKAIAKAADFLRSSAPVPPADGISPFACAKCGMYYCTHSISERFPTLSTSPAVAAEPDATQQQRTSMMLARSSSPTVRGDREAIARIIDPDAKWGEVLATGSDDNNQILLALAKADAILSLPVQPVTPRLPQDTLDRLAMLNVSEEEVYEVLTKHLPEDMIDGIWQE